MRKITLRSAAALLAAVMLLSVIGCSNKSTFEVGGEPVQNGDSAAAADDKAEDNKPVDAEKPVSDNKFRHFQIYNNFEEYSPEKHLNAEEVFDKLTYIPQMFYGSYINEDLIDREETYLTGDDELIEKYAASANYMKLEVADKYSDDGTEEIEIGTLPMSMTAGNHGNYDMRRLSKIRKYNWIWFEVPQKSGERYYVYDLQGTYYIEGSKLIFTPLVKIEYSEDYKEIIDYELSDKKIEFGFKFAGGMITLTNSDGESVTLTAEKFIEENYTWFSADGYVASEEDKIDNICGFDIEKYYSSYDDTWRIYSRVRLENKQDNYYFNDFDNVVAHFNEDGIMQFSWAERDGTPHAYEFVYFYCDDDGLILTDGEKVYKYTATYSDYKLGAGVETTNDEELGKLEQGKVAAIAEKKKNLMDELQAAFEKEGISVAVNDDTGEIMLDSSVLFGVDQYEITDKGQEFLKKFIKAYSSVILKDDYEGFVSKIMVEGHTDSTGERKHNEELSRKRAEEVMNYCLSDKAGIDKDVKTDMEKLMEAVGYADDYPIFDEGGKEDPDKSRRVSFKFVIDMENASQLEAISEKSQVEDEEPEESEPADDDEKTE